MKKMVLYVVRHGETDFNEQGRYCGSTDIPLNENGIKQAKQLAEKLTTVNLDIIVASSLTRAKQTAEIINEGINIPLILSDEFWERNMGDYEGLSREEIELNHPDMWEKLDDASTSGEAFSEFEKRIINALKKLENNYPDKNVLLVAHGGVAMAINRHYNNLTYEEMCNGFRLGNCEVIKYII
ncbi:MAG: histidine phosphatase family protein [Oscillospiraceae bacterium]|nr:histidine phosphatase family protein [Oscillospiraceae bacterium]